MIEVENLYKNFGSVQALKGISISFNKNKTYALVGPNGCGKTTLLYLLSGFYKPSIGAVYWDNGQKRDLKNLPPYKRSLLGIGISFQEPRGFLKLSVETNLVISMMERSSDFLFSTGTFKLPTNKYSIKIDSLLKLGDMTDIRNKNVETLSYGQRKILDVLCLLAKDYKVLLLDEPFAGVDPKNLKTIINMLKKISRESQRVIIIVSHEISYLNEIADEMVFIEEGKIKARGTPIEVINQDIFKESYL
jgi:branched-chain amino acid transport system ATP-binding protein